jgi:hypothetical protein
MIFRIRDQTIMHCKQKKMMFEQKKREAAAKDLTKWVVKK